MTDEPTPMAAVQAIERVIWKNGIVGDACARVAADIVKGLAEAGFVVREASGA